MAKNYILRVNNKDLIVFTDKGSSSKTVKYNDNYNASCMSLTFNKKVYEPCSIVATLQIEAATGKTLPTPSDLTTDFINKEVALVIQTGEGTNKKEVNIAENYYVHEIAPSYQSTSTKSLYLKLYIFSNDKRLTLDKFCKAYTGKRLVKNILLTHIEVQKTKDKKTITKQDHTVLDLLDNAGVSVDTEYELKFLSYKKDNVTHEYIQPYLVQYNESFYDFLVRTANRCGEFVYYENGKLHVGLWKTAPTTKDIKTYSSVESKCKKESAKATNRYYYGASDSAAQYSSPTEKKDDETHIDYMPYNFQLSHEDYFINYKKDGWAKFTDEYKTEQEIVNAIGTTLGNNSSAVKILFNYARYTANAAITAASKAKSFNLDKNEKYIKNTISEEQKDGDNIYPFKTAKSDNGKKIPFSQDFYSDIYSKEKKAEEDMVTIHTDSAEYITVNLADIIQVMKNTYIVTEIIGSINESNDTSNNTSNNTSSNTSSSANSSDSSSDSSKTSSDSSKTSSDSSKTSKNGGIKITIKAVQAIDTSTTTSEKKYEYYPPLFGGELVRKSAPQVAFVEDSFDPDKYGRVRIKYPWQNEYDEASPWIRMATPFTAKDGGMFFQPVKGAELLIDYYGGDVEKPYVVGQLNARDAQTTYKETRVIASENGQKILMTDEKPVDIFSGLNSLLEPYLGISKLLNIKSMSNALGSIKMTDKYGIYTVSMSSKDRNITIKSPIGDVKIGALTGIEISAPNGDVKISGKNVSITASNNLDITSGKGIVESYGERLKKDATKGLVDLTAGVAEDYIGKVFSKINMTLVRTVWEALCPPKAGNFTINSARYLSLSAGPGSAQLPLNAYKNKSLSEDEGQYLVIHFELTKISQFINEMVDNLMHIYRKANSKSYFLKIFMSFNILKSNGEDLAEEDEKNIINKLFNKARSVKESDTWESIKVENLGDLLDGLSAQNENIESETIKKINDLLDTLVTLFKGIKDPQNLVNKDMYKNLNTSSLLQDVELPAEIQELTSNDMDIPWAINIDAYKKKTKRKLAMAYLKTCSSLLNMNKPNNVEDEDIWEKFVDSVRSSDNINVVANQYNAYFKEAANKYIQLDWIKSIKSQETWSNLDKGKILFSDISGETINFEEGALKNHKNPISKKECIDLIKDALKKLY